MSFLRSCLNVVYYLGLIHAFLVVDRLIGRRQILVATFHRVMDDGAASHLITGVSQGSSKSEFEFCIRTLARWFKPITLAQIAEVLDGSRRINSDSCLVSFDDAYLETLSIAAPILAKYKVAACVFVATAYVANENRFWFVRAPDVLHHCNKGDWQKIVQDPRLPSQFAAALENTSIGSLEAQRQTWKRVAPVFDSATEEERETALNIMESIVAPPQTPYMHILDWEQLRQMENVGFEIGGHTHLHPKLTTVDSGRVENELAKCWSILREQLQSAPIGFAYPQGDFDNRVKECVKRSNFRLAFTTRIGLIGGARTDRYELPRVYVPDGPPKTVLVTIALIKLSKYMPRIFLKRIGRFVGQKLG